MEVIDVSIKFNFNSKDLEKQIKKQIEKNPDIVMKQNAGKIFDATCPKCGHKGLKATSSGDAECPNCNARIKVNLNVK